MEPVINYTRILTIDRYLKATRALHELKVRLQKEQADFVIYKKEHPEAHAHRIRLSGDLEGMRREAAIWNTACNILKKIMFPGRNAPQNSRLTYIKEAEKRIEKIRRWTIHSESHTRVICAPYLALYAERAKKRPPKEENKPITTRFLELESCVSKSLA